MNETTRNRWQRYFLVLTPVVLIVALLFAFGGPFNGAASAVYGEYGCANWDPAKYPPIYSPWGQDYWVPPTACNAGVWGVNGDKPDVPFDGYVNADELQNSNGTGILQDSANKGRVHIIDVRTNYENQGDACPMQIVLGMPIYTETNAGHPIWQWPDGTLEESYSVPFFIGFYWAGTANKENGQSLMGDPAKWAPNVRPEPNPNFVDLGAGSYFSALVADREINKDDTIIVMCQSGWRASYAATVIKNMGFQDVKVLYGGFLGWMDDYYSDDGKYPASGPNPDPSPGDCPDDGDPATPPANCDPDNNPGPAARDRVKQGDPRVNPKYAYDITRLARNGQPVMWDGKEPHVAVKPEWMAGFGATDFKLSLDGKKAYWASLADYQARILSVEYTVKNNQADYVLNPDPLNYADSCGGPPPPYGTGSCPPVFFTPWGPSYNSRIETVEGLTNGVTAVSSSLPATVGPGGLVAPGLTGTATVRYQVPVGVASFSSNPRVVSNDVPDPKGTLFGPDFDFYFTYGSNHWQDSVTVPDAPSGFPKL